MKSQIILISLVILFGVLTQNQVESCSCMLAHPQEQYCSADFVIVARIRKDFVKNYQRIYKVKVRKEFKMSEKARIALKSGKLLTAVDDSMCGVRLEVGKMYLITGKVHGLQAYVNLCNFIKPWKDITNRQRKGFRLIYGRGCGCKISTYYHTQPNKDNCGWTHRQCQEKYGICLRSPSGQCNWTKSKDLKQCINGENVAETLKNKQNFYTDHNGNKKKYYNYKARNLDEIKTS